jgi:hypothetical protein
MASPTEGVHGVVGVDAERSSTVGHDLDLRR